jgi:hypothetical protein
LSPPPDSEVPKGPFAVALLLVVELAVLGHSEPEVCVHCGFFYLSSFPVCGATGAAGSAGATGTARGVEEFEEIGVGVGVLAASPAAGPAAGPAATTCCLQVVIAVAHMYA